VAAREVSNRQRAQHEATQYQAFANQLSAHLRAGQKIPDMHILKGMLYADVNRPDTSGYLNPIVASHDDVQALQSVSDLSLDGPSSTLNSRWLLVQDVDGGQLSMQAVKFDSNTMSYDSFAQPHDYPCLLPSATIYQAPAQDSPWPGERPFLEAVDTETGQPLELGYSRVHPGEHVILMKQQGATAGQ